jgi:hypothetical protein
MADRRQIGYVSSTVSTAVPAYAMGYGSSPYYYTGSSYRYAIFTASGTFVASTTSADVIVVAGGGGAGAGGGGGGAGGVRNLIAATFVVGNSYAVTVGAAGTSHNTTPTNGGNSSIVTSSTTISATGGGRGGTASQAAASGGSGGGAYSTNSGAAGNAGSYTPVEGYAGATGRNSEGGSSGSGGGATSAALAGAQGAPYGGGNRDVSGRVGTGFALPNDLTNFSFFDLLRAPSASSQYTNTIIENVAIAWGGMGYGYAGYQGVWGVGQGVVGNYTGGFGSTYNTPVVGAKGYGSGACSGTGTYGYYGSATGGIVIVRYAL